MATILAGCVAGVGYRAAVVAPAPVVVETAPPPPPPPPPEPAYVEEPVVEVEYREPQAYVYVNPQVQVIEDYDYPVFFADGLYWRNDGGVWYSSSYHDRGWGRDREAPAYVRTIERPEHYTHYRPDPRARAGQPGYRYIPPAPIRHTAPPPRYVEQPGRPARPPVERGHGPVVTQPGRVEQPHPVEPVRPTRVEPPGRVEQPHPVEPPQRPAEPPRPTRVQQPEPPRPTHTVEPQRPAEPPRPTRVQQPEPPRPTHTVEPVRTAPPPGPARVNQPTRAAPPAPPPPPPSKAPPPAAHDPKKKRP